MIASVCSAFSLARSAFGRGQRFFSKRHRRVVIVRRRDGFRGSLVRRDFFLDGGDGSRLIFPAQIVLDLYVDADGGIILAGETRKRYMRIAVGVEQRRHRFLFEIHGARLRFRVVIRIVRPSFRHASSPP